MRKPSPYELDAWQEVQNFRGRMLSRGLTQVNNLVGKGAEKVSEGTTRVGEFAQAKVEASPRAEALVGRVRGVTDRGAKFATKTARRVGDQLPDWEGSVAASLTKNLARISRAGLSADGVVRKHAKAGHGVTRLAEIRRLDLEQVDAVRGRGMSWYYPAFAAASGAGAGLAMTGGSLSVTVSGGASTAPSAGVVAGAYIADGVAVLGLSSRSVGQIALSYGYDPESPAEKLFILAVVNAGTALTASAKHAAFSDISKLTQALVRGKSWTVLNESLLAQVASKFTNDFTGRLTRQGLGKVVPGVGMVIGATFNWSTLESIVDAADVAYRRRFLLEKYPDLAIGDVGFAPPEDDSEGVGDVDISVVEVLERSGVIVDEDEVDEDL